MTKFYEEREHRQNEAWCIELLKTVSPSERHSIVITLGILNRVKSQRGIDKINELLSEGK